MNSILKVPAEHDFETLKKDNKVYLNLFKSSEIFNNKGIKVAFEEDEDMQLAVFRIDGQLHCLSNVCPHRHMEEIYNGIIRDMQITCPIHGWTYEIETGKNINPAQGLRSLKKYGIFETNGKVFVEKPELDIPKWRKLQDDNEN